MKKIEKIALNEREQKIYMDFLELVSEIDRLSSTCTLTDKLIGFQDAFDEIIVDW